MPTTVRRTDFGPASLRFHDRFRVGGFTREAPRPNRAGTAIAAGDLTAERRASGR
jgi:hypothetical protein